MDTKKGIEELIAQESREIQILEQELEQKKGVVRALREALELTDASGRGEQGSKQADRGIGSIREAVREITRNRADTFTAPELWEEVRTRYRAELGDVHKASVSAAVKELAKDGELKIEREGAGRRATVYSTRNQEGGEESTEGSDKPTNKNAEAEG